jgi:hypothetical protein
MNAFPSGVADTAAGSPDCHLPGPSWADDAGAARPAVNLIPIMVKVTV